MKKIFSLLLAFMLILNFAQNQPEFWGDIQKFKKLDQQTPPPKNAILLVGSSSFTMWQDVGDYFPNKTIINRGFGGSRLVDLNRYSNELLDPYNPKQIIVYCGENDFAHAENPKVKTVVKRWKQFYNTIRTKYPDINIAYISMKHSPSREQYWKKMERGNRRIQKFMKHQNNAEYIDIVRPMDDEYGDPKPALFLEDMLHMKPAGYRIWQQVMQPYLE